MGIFKTTALVAALTIGTVGAASATELAGGGFGVNASSSVHSFNGAAGAAIAPGTTTVGGSTLSSQGALAGARLTFNNGLNVSHTSDFDRTEKNVNLGFIKHTSVDTTFNSTLDVDRTIGVEAETWTAERSDVEVKNWKTGNGPAVGGAISLGENRANADAGFGAFSGFVSFGSY